MSRDYESFHRRFPSYESQVSKEPRVTKHTSINVAKKLSRVLESALPELQLYADREPYAQPIYIESGFRKKGLTAGWIFGIKNWPGAEPSSRSTNDAIETVYVLTEEGDVGAGYCVEPNIVIVQRVKPIGERALSKAFPGSSLPDPYEAEQRISQILIATGAHPSTAK